jgi:hypothetical protein
MRTRTLGWRLSVLAFGAYLAVAVLIFLPIWRDPTRLLIGNYGDTKFFLWVLGWTPHALAGGHNPLLTTHLNHPLGVNLMWNNSVPLLGLVLSPLMAIAGPTVTYNAAVTLGLALSAWAAYLAISRLGLSRPAALVGGLLYGFSPYMLDHSFGHLPIVFCALPPLTLVLLHELLVRRRWPAWRVGVLFALLAGAQVLISLELLATTVLFAFLGVMLLAVASPRHLVPRELLPRASRLLVAFAIALPLAALAAGPPLAVMFLGPQHVRGELRAPDVYVNDLATFVIPTPMHWLASPSLTALAQRWSANWSETANGYLGLPLILLLAGVVLWRVRSPLVRWAALFGLVAAILSMGPHVHVNGVIYWNAVLPWALVQNLPIFVQILPARFALYTSLAAAILLAVFVDRLGAARPAWLAGLGWLAVVVALLPLVPAEPTHLTHDEVPAFFAPGGAVSTLPEGSVAFVLPYATDVGTVYPGPAWKTGVDAMAWQAHSGYRFRMPTGYVIVPGPDGRPSHGPVPTTTSQTVTGVAQGGPVPTMTPELRRGMAADLQRWGVRYVIVGPMAYERAEVELMTRLLNRPPEEVDGVYLWREVDPWAI